MIVKKSECDAWQEKYYADATINMGTAEVDSLSVEELLDFCSDSEKKELMNISHMHFQYLTPKDDIELKEAISSIYRCDTSHIATTTGTNISNKMVFETLLEEEDEVVCIMPVHQQLFAVPHAMNVTVKYYMVIEYENWKIDMEALEKLCSSHTKMIVINYPNNPLGLSLSEEEMEALIELCERYDCYLLNDEVFYGLGSMPSFVSKYEKAIVTSSLSKSYGLAGVRIGWIVANERVIERIEALKKYEFVSQGQFDMQIAKIAIQHREQILKRNNAILQENSSYLKSWLENEPYFTGHIPDGGTTAFIGYKLLDTTSKEVAFDILEKEQVLVIPGIAFGMDDYIRISVGLPYEKFVEGLSRISRWMKARKG